MPTSLRRDDARSHVIEAESISFTMFAIPTLVVVGCAVVASAAPIGVSIIAVFLFAGPHKCMEARYFLSRMPARWGGLALYFSLGLAGSLFLGGMFAAPPSLAGDSSESGLLVVAVWNSSFTAWIVVLARLRCRQNPRRDWPVVRTSPDAIF